MDAARGIRGKHLYRQVTWKVEKWKNWKSGKVSENRESGKAEKQNGLTEPLAIRRANRLLPAPVRNKSQLNVDRS
jgi:hypothetical protein